MHRWARALPSALALLALLALTAGTARAAGPPFPDPVVDQAVYDTADVLRPETEAELERLIDGVEARTGAEIVVYTQHSPDISEDRNLDNARALMDEWGVGRRGFDDGMVLMVGLDPDPGESRVSMFAGAGFLGAYANEEALRDIIATDFVPPARMGDLDGAVVATIRAIESRMTPASRDRLEILRVANAVLGLAAAPAALAGTLLAAWRHWRRHGDDPELIDSPSVLMAGPPAGMTPPLATVVRGGTATQHTINTTLVELAARGRIAFRNLDRVRSVKSDDDPDPLTDPAIVVRRDADGTPLGRPQSQAWDAIRRLGGASGELRRRSLWRLNETLDGLKREYESEAVRLGWLTREPTPQITRMTWVGIGVGAIGAGGIWIGLSVPMSGALLLGAALVLGGIGTVGFARAMSQRTYQGAYVDAMLKAYRRTLRKTMEQARSMGQVVTEPEVAVLADTPDKAVLWGIALGLHDEVGRVIARGLEEERRATGSTAGAYYPTWLGSTSSGGRVGTPASSAVAAAGISPGSGSIFSGSAIPDIGGMLSALGSVGSTPPSSSSSSSGGGGFSGGGSSGGGGASGSF
jgi:uncharacterized membrane protein YgcG